VRCRDGDRNFKLFEDFEGSRCLVVRCSVPEDERLLPPAAVLDIQFPNQVADEDRDGLRVGVGLTKGDEAVASVIEDEEDADAGRPALLSDGVWLAGHLPLHSPEVLHV
jgi:hypothetical protein